MRRIQAAHWGTLRAMSAPHRHIQKLLGWLGDRERQHQLALEAADLGTWNWDPSTNDLVWSERCRSLIGASPDEPADLDTFIAKIHPDDRDVVRRAIETGLKSTGIYSVEYRVVLPSGEIRWLHSLGRAHFTNEHDQTLGMSGIVRDVTQAHFAAETVARQQQYLEQLLEAAPTGVAKLDRELRFVAVNSLFLQSLRIAQPTVIGLSLDAVLPDMPAHWRDEYRRCLAGTPERSDGEAFPRADGTSDWTNRRMLPWYDERNEIGGIVLIMDVVTQQRRLEDQERLWISAFAHHTHGMAVLNPSTGTLRSANAAYGRLLGCEAAALVGVSILDCHPATEHARLRDALAQADVAGTASIELWRRHSDGSALPSTLDLVSVHDHSGLVRYQIATLTDRPERSASAPVPAATGAGDPARSDGVDQQFRLLAESTPIGIVRCDQDGTITYANPAWLAIVALAAEDTQGMNRLEAIHPDDRERVLAASRKALQNAAVELEFRYQRATGEVRWVQSHVTVLRDDADAPSGFVYTGVDITEQILEREAKRRFHSQVRSLAHRLDHLRDAERGEVATALQQGLLEDLTSLKFAAGSLAKSSTVSPETLETARAFAAQAAAAVERLRHLIFQLKPPAIE